MSVFDDIPEGFPLRIGMTTRPVRYTLKTEQGDRFVVVVLSLMWLILGPVMIWGVLEPSPDAAADNAAFRWNLAMAISAVYLAIAGRYWLLPNIVSSFARADITISNDAVSVEQADLFRRSRFTEPLHAYIGVGIENWGTRQVEEAKIPISAIVLKHRDDSRSIPLAIDGALRIKAGAAARLAKELGVEVLDGVQDGEGDIFPVGAVLRNHWQAFKVRAISTGLLMALACMIAAVGYQAVFDTVEPALVILVALFAGICVAMEVYARHYAVLIDVDGEAVTVKTASAFKTQLCFPTDAIQSISYREGRANFAHRHRIHTPWVKMHIRGQRLPMMIDMQADFVDETWLLKHGGR